MVGWLTNGREMASAIVLTTKNKRAGASNRVGCVRGNSGVGLFVVFVVNPNELRCMSMFVHSSNIYYLASSDFGDKIFVFISDKKAKS